jgi:hypothetical protein
MWLSNITLYSHMTQSLYPSHLAYLWSVVNNTFSIHTAGPKLFHPKEAFIGKLQHANSYVKGIYLEYMFLGAFTKYHKSDY